MKYMKNLNILIKLLLCTQLLQINLPSSLAQDWTQAGYIDNNSGNWRVLELYPDSVSGKLYIGGQFKTFGTVTTRNITAFDGVEFEAMTQDVNVCFNYGCTGVPSITRYNGQIIASTIQSATFEATPQIVGIGAWDGKSWHALDGGIADFYNPNTKVYEPAELYDFCIADGLLYVAGYLKWVDSVSANGMAAWDGNKWLNFNVPDPPPGDAILSNCVAKYKDAVYLGGNFSPDIQGDTIIDLLKYENGIWSKVGDGLVGSWTNLHDMEVFQDRLIIAGYFTQEDGNVGNSIMSWDGTKWDDMGGGICSQFGALDDLFVYKDKLYVAGQFDCIGNINARNVAVWDGKKWCSIGNSYFDKPAHAIAVWRDTIYVGGSFLKVNGAPLKMFAKFVGDHSNDQCGQAVSVIAPEQEVPILQIAPNPAINYLNLQLENSPAPIESIEILDAAGRNCSQLIDWKTTDYSTGQLNIQCLPAGWYCVRVRCSDRVLVGRFVKG